MKRNITLDYYRILLSILVIYLHFVIPIVYDNFNYHDYMSSFEYTMIWEISGFTKLVVPSFFLINGYYLPLNDQKKVVKYLIRILKLYVIWTLIYLPWMPHAKTFGLYLNLILGFYHLWYLPALIGGVIFLYLLNKLIKNSYIILLVAIVLFFAGYIIQLSSLGSISVLYRNSIFYAIPYLALGFIIRKIDINRIKFLIPLIIVGIAINLTESFYYMKIVQYFDIYLSGIILCPAIFILILKNSKVILIDKNDKLSDLSSAIYFIHPIFLLLLSSLISPGNNTLMHWFPFIVFIVILNSFQLITANKKFKIFL